MNQAPTHTLHMTPAEIMAGIKEVAEAMEAEQKVHEAEMARRQFCRSSTWGIRLAAKWFYPLPP